MSILYTEIKKLQNIKDGIKMKRQKTVDKLFETTQLFNTNILTGQQIGCIPESEQRQFGSVGYIRQELRKAGYYTRMFGPDIQFARKKFSEYSF